MFRGCGSEAALAVVLAAARGLAYLFFVYTEEAVAIILVAASPDGFAVLVMAVTAHPGR